jgi:hypothetical protein
MFSNAGVRAKQDNWLGMARFVVAAFRADAIRAGAASEVNRLVEELCQLSPEFAALWRDNDIRVHGEGTKRLQHPLLGPLELEYSSFAVDGRPDLGMIVYNPATLAQEERIRELINKSPAAE